MYQYIFLYKCTTFKLTCILIILLNYCPLDGRMCLLCSLIGGKCRPNVIPIEFHYLVGHNMIIFWVETSISMQSIFFFFASRTLASNSLISGVYIMPVGRNFQRGMGVGWWVVDWHRESRTSRGAITTGGLGVFGAKSRNPAISKHFMQTFGKFCFTQLIFKDFQEILQQLGF